MLEYCHMQLYQKGKSGTGVFLKLTFPKFSKTPSLRKTSGRLLPHLTGKNNYFAAVKIKKVHLI